MNVLDESIRDFYTSQRMPDERVADILAAARRQRQRIVWFRPYRLAAAAALALLLGGSALWWSIPRA